MSERRFTRASPRVERREKPDGSPDDPHIVGHAAVFDEWTTLYEGRYWTWREVIRPGAFANAVKERQDVRALFNHDSNFILGRTKSHTLVCSEDARGLMTDCRVPGTRTILDLVVAPMERGDLDGMSFAFCVRKGDTVTRTETEDGTVVIENGGERITIRYEGERCVEERELLDLDLSDVSPVTFPQYEGTDVALRAHGPDIAERAREMDRPHVRTRPAPKRDELRRWLDQGGGVAAPARAGSAAPGRKG